MLSLRLSSLLGFFSLILLVVAEEQCPFDGCKCEKRWHDRQGTFFSVSCEVGSTFPSLVGSKQYYVRGSLTITGNVEKIPADAFSAFQFIDTLHLVQNGTNRSVNIDWDEKAFNGVEIKKLKVTNLPGIIPLPEAMKELGKNDDGLHGLTICEAGQAALEKSFLSSLRSVKYLEIRDTVITKIDEGAFSGLEEKIVSLSLVSTSLTNFPRESIKKMVNLELLDLSNNKISDIKKGDFDQFTKLTRLVLSGNNLQAPVDSGALDKLPESLKMLELDQCSLSSVPAALLAGNLQITLLTMTGNEIKALKKGDFPVGTQLLHLYLKGNPIAEIENGSINVLKKVEILDLKETKLTSFDMAMCNEMNTVLLELSDNKQLKSVDTTSMDMPSYQHGIGGIYLSNTGIEHLDSKFSDMIECPYFSVFMFENNKRFVCDETDYWMAPHSLCSNPHLQIDNTICSNGGMSLRDSLTKHVPDPCKGRTATPGL